VDGLNSASSYEHVQEVSDSLAAHLDNDQENSAADFVRKYFLSVQRQLTIRTIKFLQAFAASDNHLCSLFESVAVSKLNSILTSFSVKATNQLVNGLYDLS